LVQLTGNDRERKAEYSGMTQVGKKHLAQERSRWESFVQAVARSDRAALAANT
jgi:hypothetical protein